MKSNPESRREIRRNALASLVAVLALARAAPADEVRTPPGDVRGAEQTFLTFPEWYLVYSPREMADYFRDGLPGEFPYFAHIGQFWSSYDAVRERTRDEFPFNAEYHTMLNVIGISTTLEYGVKGAWEATLGSLAEAAADGEFTAEDRFAAAVAQDYVDFILERPWYEFDYAGALARLWTQTPFFGEHMLRKLERKYILTSEYLVKALYARLIGFGSAASFDAPVHRTAVIADRDPGDAAGPELVMLPRYQPFTRDVIALAERGAAFVEIAGNRGRIAISLLGEAQWNPDSVRAERLLLQPVITRPGTYRHIVEVDVARLGAALRGMIAAGLEIEHVYDY